MCPVKQGLPLPLIINNNNKQTNKEAFYCYDRQLDTDHGNKTNDDDTVLILWGTYRPSRSKSVAKKVEEETGRLGRY